MKIKLKNTSGYSYDDVSHLVRLGLRLHDSTRAKLRKVHTTMRVEVTTGKRAWLTYAGRCSLKITVPKPPPGEYLSVDNCCTVLRLLRWAAMRSVCIDNRDMTPDQLCYTGPIATLPNVPQLRYTGAHHLTGDGKQAAHAKKVVKAQKMLSSIAHQQSLLEARASKWKRKLSALQASSHRVGKPAGTRAPKLTADMLRETDAAFASLD